MGNMTIKGSEVKGGVAGVVISPSFAIVENLKFTPRYNGPAFEVEDDQGVVKACALQSDGGDFQLDTVWIDNVSTLNLQALRPNANVTFTTKTVNNNVAINAFVVAEPEVTFPRKGETKISLKLAWRPGIQ